MSAPLFTRYLAVDWSAAARPVHGADSIWIAEVARGDDGDGRRVLLENPPTRAAATARLIAIARDRLDAGERVLIGFDFPFGYPAGTAAALGLAGGLEWRKLWARIDALVDDGPDNANNRFQAAAALNAELTGEAFPFWGCPEAQASPHLKVRGRRAHGRDDLAERRLVEARVKRTQPVWKLAGVGAVGGQALTGVPRVWAIRTDADLAFRTQIWPFETGLTEAPAGDLVLAELYPSLVPPEVLDGLPKDAGQVSAVARALARMDGAGRLGALFAGDPALTPAERAAVEREEAWILGVGAAPALDEAALDEPGSNEMGSHEGGDGEVSGRDYIRDPAAIYRESFRLIREAADLSALPDELHPMARRLIHAVGRPEVADSLAWSDGAIAAGRAALEAGAPVLVDAKMVAAGVVRARLPAGNDVLCLLDAPGVAGAAKRLGTTRSAAQVGYWTPWLAGAVVAIGNAPTALFALLEAIEAGGPKPALVLGFPVGFVGAAESKQALIDAAAGLGLPFIALTGREGGSALAAAAVNALAQGNPEEAGG